jgi:multisubunit Na+/H+ antiporter MnhB subunit
MLCLGVTAGLAGIVLGLPDPAPTLAPTAREFLGSTDLGNAATAVLMAYRALDTMLEKVVLLLALVAVWSLAPDRFWGGRPLFGSHREKDGPLIFLARALIPIGVLTGVYLFWVGADAPAGAFAGGAIIAAMGILGFIGERILPAVFPRGRGRGLSLGQGGWSRCWQWFPDLSGEFRQGGHRSH